MWKKVEGVKQSHQQEVYYLLLSRYEKALYRLGMDEEEVESELAEFIQLYDMFR